ncbi:hypothetical protein BMF94_1841 [Rhodotorula taiwanensis]|uniref:Major facilitator superfamily (MFS) profile domain-containing protein n=1 Tax=Rhodotorula taiwanensis TaxID=741276 RepID=A0A2S5BEL4_9BASI|nr:hypothetical protein BMF94_1841 [Rhodotorula taiwanensis]
MAGGAVSTGAVAAGPQLTKRERIFAFALVASLFFAWGLSYSFIDVLNKKAQSFFSITKLKSTMLQVAYFGAYLVMSIPASMFATRFGYRKGVLLGLGLYVVGALGFWPSAHYEKYVGFVVSAFVIASGLATLETMANSYASVLGSPEGAAFRLNAAQSFNGLATFIGPQIASHTFFGGKNANSLGAVQFVYLGVACFGVALFALFCFAKLPEISEAAIEEQQEASGLVDERPLWKRKHTIFGFITQFCYVGAQVSTASFVMNFLTDRGLYTEEKASQIFSYMQLTFARILSTPLLKFFPAPLVLVAYGIMTSVFSLVAALTGGKTGMACLFLVFWGESVIYPTTFTLATSNLGIHTKRGAGLLCMGVAGGALFPPLQGLWADAKNTDISYIINAVGFAVVIAYGIGMFFYNRRMAKKIADASLYVNTLPATGMQQDEKDAASLEKVEVDDVHYENTVRV